MKPTMLILVFFFLACEKETVQRTPKDEVCLEIQASSPVIVSGFIGKTAITRASCAYIVRGDSVYVEIHASTPTYLTIKLFKNNKLVAQKGNNCAYTYYQLRQKF
ncbi:MAG TPA: hypothetical protein DIW47_07995 [Bacteroidetes bacterium]|nr:hypothetical protein [Bacteroidota bacterium]